jgi:hypothetical protein
VPNAIDWILLRVFMVRSNGAVWKIGRNPREYYNLRLNNRLRDIE